MPVSVRKEKLQEGQEIGRKHRRVLRQSRYSWTQGNLKKIYCFVPSAFTTAVCKVIVNKAKSFYYIIILSATTEAAPTPAATALAWE